MAGKPGRETGVARGAGIQKTQRSDWAREGAAGDKGRDRVREKSREQEEKRKSDRGTIGSEKKRRKEEKMGEEKRPKKGEDWAWGKGDSELEEKEIIPARCGRGDASLWWQRGGRSEGKWQGRVCAVDAARGSDGCGGKLWMRGKYRGGASVDVVRKWQGAARGGYRRGRNGAAQGGCGGFF